MSHDSRRAGIVSFLVIAQLAIGPSVGRVASTAQELEAPSDFSFQEATSGKLDLPRLPRGFFGRGSDPKGPLRIEGNAIGNVGPFELDDSDTVVMALGLAQLPSVGASTTVPLVMAEMDWQSTKPMRVVTRRRIQRWNAEMGLSTLAEQPHGQLTLTRTNETGGTFKATLKILPRIVFTRRNSQRVLDAGEAEYRSRRLVLNATSVPWTTTCPADLLEVPLLSGPACLGATPDGPMNWKAEGSRGRLNLSPALDIAGPPAEVHPSATVSPEAHLGSGSVVLEDAQIERNVVLGPNSLVGMGATLGEGAIVGRGTQIGDGAVFGPGAIVGEDSVIGSAAQLESGVVAANDVFIGNDAIVQQGATLGSRTRIGASARMGRGVIAGIGVTIGDAATVVDDLFLAEGASVGPETTAEQDLLTCVLPGGESIATDVETCDQANGAVEECLPPPAKEATPPPRPKQLTPGTKGKETTQLQKDVDESGIGDRKYVETTYDCDDFASDLEIYLQKKGYDATFTMVTKLNPDYGVWSQLWEEKWLSGHCYTDVRLPGGGVVWIEAQRTSKDDGVSVGVNLDFDNDGKVGTVSKPGASLTEDSAHIEVYDSLQAAKDAGVKNLD